MMYDVLDGALGSMPKGPKLLARALEFSAESNAEGEVFSMAALLEYLRGAAASESAPTVLRRTLARWDNDTNEWAEGTERNSADRRSLIYSLLQLDEAWIALCDAQFPFHPLEAPSIIATEHKVWYTDERRRPRDFYWKAYAGQLERQGWIEDSVRQLDASTTSIVERLADPASKEGYQSKGLVVGYVQSGKTANFTGVVAKAADAGYKLIIVLAGTLDVLRSQTQRRIDKEMIGRPLVNEEYSSDDDWNEFLDHQTRPSEMGSFDWYRLTGPESDYQSLARGVDALKFELHDPGKPLWDKDNLYRASTRIAIVKKNSTVLGRLLTDLRDLKSARRGAPLDQVPTLIIDDESDQASINVQKRAPAGVVQERTATNKAIVDLLKLLPRAQYLGYTATPFANVFVDPASEEDIFPKDFLISLPRPDGYMGVSDFYDLDASETDEDSRPNERDYVRAVKGVDTAPGNLPAAIDAFVLSGALKLYRKAADPKLNVRHHTMLAHLSPKVAEHRQLAAAVRDIYAKAAYDGGDGLERLERLFEDDFRRVHRLRGAGAIFPETFDELTPFIADCLGRIEEANQAVLVLNNESKGDTPDFDKQSVWKILVGGTKLSRGYTVEGLTVSYYRRTAGAADTLMQMGRWFGFRRGYRDLVRLYIGTEEGSGAKKTNLYEAFGAVCRDEELFREELKRYAKIDKPRITPAQIPPLVPQHMLRPTAANKMYNAVVTHRNFANALSESTFAPTDKDEIRANSDAMHALLESSKITTLELSSDYNDRRKTIIANTAEVTPAAVIALLKKYIWYNKGDKLAHNGNPLQLQIEFLEKTSGDPEIDDWLVLSPRITKPTATFKLGGAEFDVVNRSRHDEQPARFHTYNDPVHRAFARHISRQIELTGANAALTSLRKPRRAVMIYYPITDVEKSRVAKPPYTVGFTLLFPSNRIATPIGFTVRRKEAKDAPMISIGRPTPEREK